MFTKSRRFMEQSEFKSRQGFFDFFCAKSYEWLKNFHKECRSGWKELFFPKDTTKQEQKPLFWDSKYHGRKTVESWNGFRLVSF